MPLWGYSESEKNLKVVETVFDMQMFATFHVLCLKIAHMCAILRFLVATVTRDSSGYNA